MKTINKAFTFLCFALAAGTHLAWADVASDEVTPSTSIPMKFQADKNNIQVLPQRFEYGLLDENQIKIGDVLIDSTTFGFQVGTSVSTPGMYRARFVWPYGLAKNGSILIRNNTGKSIWTSSIRAQDVKLVKRNEAANNENSTPSSLRTQLAEYTVDRIPASVIEDMQYLPFMTFCVSKASEGTRILLCSREVFLSSANGKLAVKPRSLGKKSPSVMVNGRTVSNQGIIFLNDETQNIGFRSTTASGAVLEIETRMKRVDFKDVILSEDKKNLILTASGAEPVAEEKIQRLSSDEWRATVDTVRPVLYLKGAGDIPMRQEFYVKGDMPTEAHRPKLTAPAFYRIYRSHAEYSGTAAPGTTVSTNAKNERVESTGETFRWWIDDIPAGITSRHYLQVAPSFAAAFDIHREFAWEADLGAALYMPAAQGVGYGAVTWWAENFLGFGSSWADLRWGVRLTHQQLLNKKTGEANLNISDFELLWRANRGFHFLDATWGLSLAFENLQSAAFSASTFGVGGFYSSEPMAWLSKWFQWQEVRATYLMPTSGTIKLNSGLKLETIAYKNFDARWSLHTGVGAVMYSFDEGTNKPQALVKAGATYRF